MAGGRIWRRTKLAGVVTLAILVLIVIFQNVGPVTVRVLFFKENGVPLAVLPVGTLVVGFVIGFLVARMRL